ncbi:MAG: PKD domain-containing protein [Flavobacteriales bacterium]|jgi:Zn-dependent metalloprotease|nr:PKD domain-containing protein [Flavobacteriales bacterium]MBT3964135.1 PKD domain-containing protein [Flavobacteriales bacterium]MBT4704264.1 PKD domain-containing protein [Flavobacteriales bacterium]MBT4930580.1 PKD domain-containing protein [Flavobacteriales bacterium]MBT6383251.1 PKD domain-containing protein [Flavobacteriales bacterium]
MKKFLLLAACAVGLTLSVNAEQVLRGAEASNAVKGAETVRYKDFSSVPAFIKFYPDTRISYLEWEEWMKSSFFKNSKDLRFELIGTERDELGMFHYRYQQTSQSYPLTFGTWIVHTLNGEVVSMNGEVFDSVPQFKPTKSEEQALQLALSSIGADIYKWEIELEEQDIKVLMNDANATYFPKGELEIVNNDASLKEVNLNLTWKFNVYAHEPMSRREIYVDATTGDIIFENNLIHHADSNGQAVTGYLGVQPITTDWTGSNFRLRETGRGNGVRTFDLQNATAGMGVDFTHSDNFWDTTTVKRFGTDAHFGAEATYDYYMNHFNRNSINDQGFALVSRVHYGSNYGNAFWNGQVMTYGDGSSGTTPFTALDICGHEVTHGLTTFTAGLVYAYESGALNESFSDIFGAAIEYDALGWSNGDWIMGEDLGFVIRNMANPNPYGDPDTYLGTNWYTGANDNGGVHTNSGVQNFWFVLLTEGGAGTNDIGNVYNVTGIGIDDAGAIAYRNLTNYLTTSSQYSDARFYAIQSAMDLFGPCSQEVISTGMAWYAVGVGGLYANEVVADFTAPSTGNCEVPYTAEFINLSSNATSFDWDFGDGSTSTNPNPNHTYTTAGTYTVTLEASSTCGADTSIEVSYIHVGPGAPCEITLPTSGAATVQTGCEGNLYDNGGPAGNYQASTDSYVTIAPPGAGSISIDFVEFNVEEGGGTACIYDYVEVYDGSALGSNLIGKYCNSNPPPSTLTTNAGSVTIRMFADGGLEYSGFKIAWECNDPTDAPDVDFLASTESTCTGVVSFSDLSINGVSSWYWDFGDGSFDTIQHPTHTYAVNGTYTVQLTATNTVGSDSLTKTAYIDVARPDAPTGADDDICPGEFGTLIASSTGLNRWFDSPVNGNLVHVGDTFVTPVVQSSMAWYVESVEQNSALSVGADDNQIGSGAYFNSNQHLIFDAYTAFILSEVTVYATGAGDRTIELRNAQGAVLESKTINIPNGEQTITLDFDVEPGTDLQLGIAQSSVINLFRNDGGTNYPYELANVLSITKSSAGTNPVGYYYFFYDWQVQELCVSARTGIAASTGICTGVDELAGVSFELFPNPASSSVTIQMASEVAADDVNLFDVSGQLVKSFGSKENTNQFELNVKDVSAGVYFVQIETKGGKSTKQLIIQ